MARSKKRKSLAVARATGTRGGFINPALVNRARNEFERAVKKYGNKVLDGKWSIRDAQSVLRMAKTEGARKIGNKVIDMVAGKVTGDEARQGTPVPSISVMTTKGRFAGGGNPNAKNYYTKFHVGRPSTTSVERMARLAGEEIITINDTLRDSAFEGSPRTELDLQTGFNQKVFGVWKFAHVTLAELMLLYFGAVTPFLPKAANDQRIYGLTKWIRQKYQIMSNNSFFGINVKVHIYAPDSPGYTAAASITSAFDASLATAQDVGKVPQYYQLLDRQNFTNKRECVVDPKCRLEMSDRFRGRYTRVKTFSKRLNPGDVWTFDMYDHCGPGIRLDQAFQQDEVLSDSLASYMVVLETTGTKCQAFSNDAALGNASWIGNAPTDISVETHTSICAVRRLDTGLSPYDTKAKDAQEGGMLTSQLAIKTFVHDDSVNDKIQNFNVAEIAPKGGAANTVYIPVLSDTDIQYSLPASEQ